MVAAFIMGFIGSLHCLGMCGPIVLLIEGRGDANPVMKRILYNTGRIVTYMAMGAISGSIGKVVFMSGFQQHFSVILGAIILLMAGGVVFSGEKLNVFSKGILIVKNRLTVALRGKGVINNFLVGILNGFLPCGLVYMAVVYSLSGNTPLEGVFYMMMFGLGTVPALVMTTIVMRYLKGILRVKAIIPLFIAMVGVLLIVRGMGLGIPYLSPDIDMHEGHGDHVLCE